MIIDNTDSIVIQFTRNRIFIATVVAWVTAQFLKVLIGYQREKRFNFKYLLSEGGMPSSHVALSMCLAVSVGLYYGFDSGLFAIAISFSAVTMFDAQGVRRHSGKQAEALNRILEDFNAHKGLQESRLKELVGHTPVEVYMGALLGIVMALLFYRVNT
jgi:uncharacterized protein